MTSLAATIAMFSTVWFGRMSYSVPLIIVISLVYAATRHELMIPILQHALRFGMWIIAFMAVVFVILAFISIWL